MNSLFGWKGKCGAVLKYVMLVAVFFVAFSGISLVVVTEEAVAVDGSDEIAKTVICNVIGFVQKLGLPIMTGVILGSSVMAIFGKVSWPAIVMLVVFTGIFFGAGKLMQKFAAGLSDLSTANFECKAK